MYKSLLLLLIVATICTSCQKNNSTPPDNPYGLPNATQTGANMYACRINGNNYIVTDPDGGNLGTSFSHDNTRDTLGIGASGRFTDTAISRVMPIDEIWFQIDKQVVQGGTYRCIDTAITYIYLHYLSAVPCNLGGGYGGGSWFKASNGYVTITRLSGTYYVPSCYSHGSYDANSIISGTFNFIIAIPNCDTIRVTDGRFDINYSLY